jgi:hypothetical protein
MYNIAIIIAISILKSILFYLFIGIEIDLINAGEASLAGDAGLESQKIY